MALISATELALKMSGELAVSSIGEALLNGGRCPLVAAMLSHSVALLMPNTPDVGAPRAVSALSINLCDMMCDSMRWEEIER